jgi:DNA-binding CsgD family transcriptional regulator
MFVSLWIGDAEAKLVNFVTKSDIRRPPQVLEGANSFRERVWSRIIDPSTWTGLLYAIIQFPVGVAGFVLVIVVFSVAGSLIAAPLFAVLGDEALEIGGASGIVIDSAVEALPLTTLGVLTWLTGMHVIVACSTLHARWARLMLGSRGRRRAGSDGMTEPPGPTGPPPRQLLPPAEQPLDEIALPAASPAGIERGPAIDGVAAAQEHPAVRLLTAREREVTQLIARGYSNADICETCYISEGTVKTHVRNILAKLDLRDRTQVVVFAYESGLVRPGGRQGEAASVAQLIV